MIAKDRGRGMWFLGFVLAVVGIGTTSMVRAQQSTTQKYQVPPPAPNAKANPQYNVNIKDINVPGLSPAKIAWRPRAIRSRRRSNLTRIISRQQLADECLAREGKKVLELLINRTLIDQALRGKKLEITAAEIDQEIETVAKRFGIGREGWLRTLEKERGISPVQYARDASSIPPWRVAEIVLEGEFRSRPPAHERRGLRKLQYGEKLRAARMILVDKQTTAMAIWEQIRQNPGGFEKIAQDQSMDSASRSLGGLLGEPITRHAYPQTLSDAAFHQLVDGDPLDKDPSHKPQDGVFTGPIQVGEAVWVILRRESVIPAATGVNFNDVQVRKQTYEMIYEVKLKEAMAEVFRELIKVSAIENMLTGNVKLANEEKDPEYGVDKDVKLMSRESSAKDADARASAPAGSGSVPRTKLPPPAALSAEAAKQFEKLNRPLKPGGNATSTTGEGANASGSTPAAPSN